MLFGYGSFSYDDDFGVVLVFSGRKEKVPPFDFHKPLQGQAKRFACVHACSAVVV